MLSFSEINEILKSFDTNSYNKAQIGCNKQLIISIYDFLNKINLSKEVINVLMCNIAYLNQDDINIPLYLEILSKSVGFLNTYSLTEVLRVVREVHDVYFRPSLKISFEEYLHDTSEYRIRKLFLNRNGKYLEKIFSSDSCIQYLGDLKLAAAISLEQKEYNEFLCYIDEFKKYQNTYSPFAVFKVYNKIRRKVKGISRLFWDVLYGNEYIVSFYRSNIELSEIYKENIYTLDESKKDKKKEIVQLDLFTYQEYEERLYVRDVKVFQICTIYNCKEIPSFKHEKDLLQYYNKLITKNKKEMVILPKLKNEIRTNYLYDVN